MCKPAPLVPPTKAVPAHFVDHNKRLCKLSSSRWWPLRPRQGPSLQAQVGLRRLLHLWHLPVRWALLPLLSLSYLTLLGELQKQSLLGRLIGRPQTLVGVEWTLGQTGVTASPCQARLTLALWTLLQHRQMLSSRGLPPQRQRSCTRSWLFRAVGCPGALPQTALCTCS